MKQFIPDFADDASNVYRTKEFIVKQELLIGCNNVEGNSMYSHDTYYARNEMIVREYEAYFARRKRIDGKRLPCTMYTRKYIY